LANVGYISHVALKFIYFYALFDSWHPFNKQTGIYAMPMVGIYVDRLHAVAGEPNCFLRDANYDYV
jgi:hypothetical protein